MKTTIKKAYIEKLQAAYPFYTAGSRPLQLANDAADAALAGKIKLDGVCWESAVTQVTGMTKWTMKNLSELPE